jgi:hypothetical protein
MPLFAIKAREPLGDRQCAEHKGREEHEEGFFCPLSYRKAYALISNNNHLLPFVIFVFFVIFV